MVKEKQIQEKIIKINKLESLFEISLVEPDKYDSRFFPQNSNLDALARLLDGGRRQVTCVSVAYFDGKLLVASNSTN